MNMSVSLKDIVCATGQEEKVTKRTKKIKKDKKMSVAETRSIHDFVMVYDET